MLLTNWIGIFEQPINDDIKIHWFIEVVVSVVFWLIRYWKYTPVFFDGRLSNLEFDELLKVEVSAAPPIFQPIDSCLL